MDVSRIRRIAALLLIMCLLPSGAPAEETADDDWRSAWEEYGIFEYCDVQDDTLILFEGVTALGSASTGYYFDESDEWVDTEPAFEEGPRFDYSLEGGDFHKVRFPSTLKYIGMEAFVRYHFSELTLPAQLEIMERYAFVYCSCDVLRIESVLPADEIMDAFLDGTVSAIEVPEEHPLYKAEDGVLFSKDGKTLLWYPNGKKDIHYDVPKGVERIEAGAFSNEYLQTVSLPIGLKSIGHYAFSGCTRLQSMAVPLTVSEIESDAFTFCVSLELLSLPEGLDVQKTNDTYVKYYPDDAIYRGDNGDTLHSKNSTGPVYAPGRLKSAEPPKEIRPGYIRVYDSADASYSTLNYRIGRIVFLGQYENGRIQIYEPLNGLISPVTYNGELGWADADCIEYLDPQSLFEYAVIRPCAVASVWWKHLPESASWVPWKTALPQEKTYKATLFGPFIRFYEKRSGAVFACAIQDAVLTRKPDGTDRAYGIVFNPDIFSDIPLYQSPGGEPVKEVPGGTQVILLEKQDGWTQVTDGHDTGWVPDEFILPVPEENSQISEGGTP